MPPASVPSTCSRPSPKRNGAADRETKSEEGQGKEGLARAAVAEGRATTRPAVSGSLTGGNLIRRDRQDALLDRLFLFTAAQMCSTYRAIEWSAK